MENHQKSSFAVLISVFFFWGFVAASNDILIPVFKSALNLLNWQAQLVNFAFYMAYTIGSVAYVVHATKTKKDIVSRLGYQHSIALGLFISALGTLLFIPAANFNSYYLMLLGLFVVGLGFSLQQTAANPFAITLGDPKKGSQRLSLAGGINNIGSTIGPILLSFAIFGGLSKTTTEVTQIKSVETPYLLLGAAFFAVAFVFYYTGMKHKIIPGKENQINPIEEIVTVKKPILSFPQLRLGMLGIFCYVGVEVATAGNLGEYMLKELEGFDDSSTIAPYVALYWGSLMVGRWASAASIFTNSLNTKFFYKILLPYLAFGLFLGITAISGNNVTPFYSYAFVIPVLIIADVLSKDDPAKQLLLFSSLGIISLIIGMLTSGLVSVFAFISVGLFCSTLWPCIFTLATNGLGSQTTQGSSLLIMMIMGGAVISILQGVLADIPFIGIKYSYLLGVICFGYLAYYALRMKKVQREV